MTMTNDDVANPPIGEFGVFFGLFLGGSDFILTTPGNFVFLDPPIAGTFLEVRDMPLGHQVSLRETDNGRSRWSVLFGPETPVHAVMAFIANATVV